MPVKVHDSENDDAFILCHEVDSEREATHEGASCLLHHDGELRRRLDPACEETVQFVDELVTETGPLTLVPLGRNLDVTPSPPPDLKPTAHLRSRLSFPLTDSLTSSQAATSSGSARCSTSRSETRARCQSGTGTRSGCAVMRSHKDWR